MTLKIRSRSPKPNQLFIMSQCYIHANLVKIWLPVHEISCKQESVTPTPTLTPTPTGYQKKYVPLPFRCGGGGIINNVYVHYYITADTEKTNSSWKRCLELATAIIKINKIVKINLPATGNTHRFCYEPHNV